MAQVSKIIDEVLSEFEDELRNTCRFWRKSRCVLRAAGACSGQQERAAAS